MRAFLACCAIVGGCSSSSTPAGGDGGSASAGVGLSIDSADSAAAIDGIAASDGDTFIIMGITMKNTGAKVPLSTNPAMFSLATDQLLDYTPSPEQPSGACDPSVSVATGGQMQCEIAFQIPVGRTATTLSYNDQQGDTASVPVPQGPSSSATCATVASWLGSVSPNCASCVEAAAGSAGACGSQAEAYTVGCHSCQQQCDTSFATLCSCEASCDTPSCQTLFDTYTECLASTCQYNCP